MKMYNGRNPRRRDKRNKRTMGQSDCQRRLSGKKLVFHTRFSLSRRFHPAFSAPAHAVFLFCAFHPCSVLSRFPLSRFYSVPQSSHCKRCTSYSNSVRLSVRLSVPSVTRRYCVKTTARSTVLFALSGSKMCLVF